MKRSILRNLGAHIGASVDRRAHGVSLVELMIAVALLAICAIIIMGPFRYLATSSQYAKARTLANNLAQEQVEILKNKSYYSLLVSSSTTNDTRFTPAIDYDNAAYRPEPMVEGGMSFTRATRVEYVFQSGPTLTAVPWTSDDTGLKQITVYVMWQAGPDWKCITLQNLASNTSTTQLNARISGSVTRSGPATPHLRRAGAGD